MQDDYITIQQASKMFGKHSDTIRRAIKGHPEAVKRNKKENRLYISKAFLNGIFVANNDQDVQEINHKTSTDIAGNTKLIDALLAELETKNKIIEKQQETIQAITEQQARLIDQQQQLSAFNLQTTNKPTKKKKFLLFTRNK